ncbi:hypothetical protein TCAL_05092 [Tigriopus californicus]|uniref:DUF3456 domain-containing protein n=1 Tax=Tigriopus californicus TaxID=6832 RepID=A0A553NS52_TIGCA|nr:protein canopy homolog 2-like [Tigriopus californicus]TRY68240.1 hypothetical protein TCAL_05092 [Tigriopus californicus]|eukprot:TCALIF_05092-PA protein Name:"Similar to Cnpy2 Protein canopy homolog 2 (Mus musculus)" AED:0.06 eAED:0.06 QI:228/1/1/1/1/1/3/75/205
MNLFQTAMLVVVLVALIDVEVEAAKKKKKKSTKNSANADVDLFDSKTMKCLVCQSLTDEFLTAIHKIDPKKMVDIGTFRINDKGEQKRSVTPFARSQIHLMELVDTVCNAFEDYIQGTSKETKEPLIIRLTTPQGNMNPDFGLVDVVPDEELNTKLKFHCQSIVEEVEEDIIELLVDGANDSTLKEQICVAKSNLCKKVKSKDEL